jgi:hypothetical protein
MTTEKKVMFRVLIDQNEYDRDGNKTGRIRRYKKNGVELEMKGGVVEDKLGETLGYIFDQSKYHDNMERKQEHYIENNWEV